LIGPPPTDADEGTGQPVPDVLRRLKAIAAATAARVAAFPPLGVVGALALVQWAALTAVVLRVAHDGWLYDAGHRPSSGVVSALPAIVGGQTLVLLPLALWLLYAVADRLAGRVFAAWAALVWVVMPYAGLAYSNRGFRHAYADQVLTHLLGLTADPAFPAMVAFLGAGFFALRAVQTGAALDVAVTVVAAAAGAAFAPRAALVAVAPVAALAVGRRRTHAATAAAGLALLLLGVGLAVGAGLLPSPFGHLGINAPGEALSSLSENFWSGRVLEWLTAAGILGALRPRRPAGVFAAVAAVAAFLSIHGGKTPIPRNLALLHGTLPAWFAISIAIAAIPLLAPRGRAARPARVTLQSIWFRLQQPVDLGRARPAIYDERTGAAAAAPTSVERPVATPLWAAVAISSLFVLIAFVGVWNASRYPIALGYDAAEHIAYADQLIHHGTIPGRAAGGEYYTPPGYYAVAGTVSWIGAKLGMSHPHHLAQYLNVVFVLAAAALLLVLARLLFPRRPVVWVAALGFFAFLPVIAKTEPMFHPETLNMLTSTAALTLATWMLLRSRFELRWLVLLGVILGAGQLVRASNLFTFLSVAIAFLAALASRRLRRRMPLKRIGLAVAAIVLITAPWYARQAIKYRDQPALIGPGILHSVFHPKYLGSGPRPPFFGIAIDDILHRPVRPFFTNQALSETYTEIWGDWVGSFAWSSYSAGPSPQALTVLQDQSEIGVLPTLLAIAGWLGLVALVAAGRLRRIPFLPVVLLPLLAITGYLARGYITTTADGDLFKASYILTTAPIWALTFGLAFSWLTRWRLLALGLALLLVAFGVLELRFMLYGIREHQAIF
jgi:hypothetical protein